MRVLVTLLRMRECGVALLGLSAWRTRGGHLGAQRPCGLVMLKKNRDSRRGDGQRWVGEGQWVKYTWKRLAKSGARLRSGPHRAARPMGRCTTAREPTQHAPSELHAGALFTCANDARREAHCAFGQGGARLPVSAIMLANIWFFHEKTKFMAARLRVLRRR